MTINMQQPTCKTFVRSDRSYIRYVWFLAVFLRILFSLKEYKLGYQHDLVELGMDEGTHELREVLSKARTVILEGPNAFRKQSLRVTSLEYKHDDLTIDTDYPDHYYKEYERPFFEDCDPKIPIHVHPTCNDLHALDIAEGGQGLAFRSGSGTWRSVWTFYNHKDNNNNSEDQELEKIVLKLLNWDREFDQETYDHNAADAVAMDHLTASPYIFNAYGFCGQSVMTEFGKSNLKQALHSKTLTSVHQFEMARDLARGLADLQSLRYLQNYTTILPTSTSPDNNGPFPSNDSYYWDPLFAHNDIHMMQVRRTASGKMKFNDFNLGIFLRYRRKNDDDNNSTSTKEDCGAPVRRKYYVRRSPEEIMNLRSTSYVPADMSDVYAFGTILYAIVSGHDEVWGDHSSNEIRAKKIAGEIPRSPKPIIHLTKNEKKAFKAAIKSCFRFDPNTRLNALELAHAMGVLYDFRKNGEDIPDSVIEKLFG